MINDPAASGAPFPGFAEAPPEFSGVPAAHQAILQDIDLILVRLEDGIVAEHAAMDALLHRLTRKAA